MPISIPVIPVARRRMVMAAGAAILALAGPLASSAQADPVSLKIDQLVQEQDQWCWAATGLTIAQFEGYGQNTSQNDFCLAARGLPSGGTCPNQAAELSVVQQGFRSLGMTPGTDAGGAVDFDTVRAEIDANRPIETGVRWTAGGGHARVIYGYDATANSVLFSDPWGSSQRYQEMAYDSYVSNSEFNWDASITGIGA